MNDAHRRTVLAAATALTLAVAPSALADIRFRLNLPLSPPPHEALRHVPAPPLPSVVVDHRHDGRWNYENRYRDDRSLNYSGCRDHARWAFVEGRWVARPYRGAVWVDGYYDRWGRWVSGYWIRARYR